MRLRPPSSSPHPPEWAVSEQDPKMGDFAPKMAPYLQPTDEAAAGAGGHGGAAQNDIPNVAAGGAEGQRVQVGVRKCLQPPQNR